MTTPTGGGHQPQIDPILTLSQKVSDALKLGATPAEHNVPPTISAANSISPSNQTGFQPFTERVSILATDGAGTITGGHADIAIQPNDNRSWTISLSHGPDAIALGAGASTVHVGGSATIAAGTGDATVKENKGNLTFVGGSGGATVLGGSGTATIFGGSGTLVAAGGKQGDNFFIAGSGNETLTGGGADGAAKGHNTFEVVKGQTTNVTIKDFAVGDKVEFDGYTPLEVSQAHLQSTPAGTTLTLPDNTKITFIGIDAKTII